MINGNQSSVLQEEGNSSFCNHELVFAPVKLDCCLGLIVYIYIYICYCDTLRPVSSIYRPFTVKT